MAQFEHDGILYEELPDGQARVIGPATSGAPVAGPVTIGTPKPEKQYEPPSGYIGTPDQLKPIPGGPADKPAKAGGDELGLNATARSNAVAGYVSAQAIRQRVKEMREKYMAGPGATKGIAGIRDWLPGPAQQEFDSAANAVRGDVGPALGLTGGQLNSVAEAAMAVGPYIPSSSDFDTTAEDKMQRLMELADRAEQKAIIVLGGVPDANGNVTPVNRDVPNIPSVNNTAPPAGPSDGPPGVSGLTPEQESRDQAFVATNPTPEQYQAFLAGLVDKRVDPAAAAARLKALKGGSEYSGTVVNPSYQEKVDRRIAKEDKAGIGASPGETLAVQGGTLALSDEAAGVGNAAANILTSPFTGKFDPVFAYKFGRDTERQRIDNAREQLGYGGTALEVIGGLASAAPVANALASFTPRAAVAASGAVGALGGWGSGEGTADSLMQAAVGGGAGVALQGGANALLRRLGAGGRGLAPELATAAEAEGVDLIRPMVDARSRPKWGALESNPASSPTIRAGAERTTEQIEGRVANLAQGGAALETEAAGGLVQRGATRFIQRSRGVANDLYNRARNLAGDATVTPQTALTQLRQELMALNETPTVNQGEIAFINELGNDLTRGPLSVDAIRGLRASVRGRINESGLTATQAEARAVRIIDALQTDAASSLPPAAATAFRRADAFYRERMTHIDDVVGRFLGKRDAPISGEQAFQRLKSMTSPGGDGRRLGGIMRDLDPGERQDIAATIAQSLGRDAPDMPFSAAKFVSQTSKLSPSARRTIFGPDGAQSITNLRTISQALKESGADINRSRTANSVIRNMARTFVATLTGLGGVAATGGVEGAVGGVALASGAMALNAGANVLSARAMVNPRVSMWLARAVDVNTPSQAQALVRQLGVIVGREPALARELTPIYEMLQRRVTPQLAAEEPQTDN